jgi:hypothetical protein
MDYLGFLHEAFDVQAGDPQSDWAAGDRWLDDVVMPSTHDHLQEPERALPEPSESHIHDDTLTRDGAAWGSGLLAWQPLVSIVADDIVDAARSLFAVIDYSESDVLTAVAFTHGGTFDPEHGCVVVGDVAHDMQYVDKQTGPTCALMAQEQFVERYRHYDIPESVLAWRAQEWGYYQPEGLSAGTNWFGQEAVLEAFDIPHSREHGASIQELDASLENGNDVLIGVDARSFYHDPTMPWGAGHQVAVVGWGVDPSSRETVGYYITDTNCPNTVRFLNVKQLEGCWSRDMISVAAPSG